MRSLLLVFYVSSCNYIQNRLYIVLTHIMQDIYSYHMFHQINFHYLIQVGNTVSHFSYASLIKCKITQKRNVIFLFWDYQRKAHLYLHYQLQLHWDQIRNEWENGSWRALPSKHHFTLHYFKWNSDHMALFSGLNFCYARDKSQFILGKI